MKNLVYCLTTLCAVASLYQYYKTESNTAIIVIAGCVGVLLHNAATTPAPIEE